MKSAVHGQKPVLLYVVNVDWFFVSHRLHLACAAVAAGFEVHVAAEQTTTQNVERIRSCGIVFHRIGFARGRASALAELRALFGLIRLYRAIRPQIVHHVTSKPILLGTLAARVCAVPAIVNAISGLGYLFSDTSRMGSPTARAVLAGYRFLLKSPRIWIVFQNRDDAALFQSRRIGRADHFRIIRGSGVDPATFVPGIKDDDHPLVVLPARMLWDKGVREFCEAAASLAPDNTPATFELVGGIDTENPASIPADWLEAQARSGTGIRWIGHCGNMAELLGRASIVCLPSYREGLPKALLEAASCECALVATDVPGCREIVIHEATGLLVPAQDSRALANALRRLIADLPLRKRLGAAARALVVSELSISQVQAATLALYSEIVGQPMVDH